MQHHGNGGKDLGKRWFSLEHSPSEICSLTRLKREMNSSLLFEHGGEQRANPLWVVCILLGHLFCKRVFLGWAMEVFMKNHRREAMRSMVKLQDLVDLAEPPLGGTSEASSSDHPKDEAMKVDEEDEYQNKATVGF